MSVVEQILSGAWNHDDDTDRIESVAINAPEISEQMTRLALRFISAKGLAGEFADTLEEIMQIDGIEDSLAKSLGDIGVEEDDAEMSFGG